VAASTEAFIFSFIRFLSVTR